MKTTLRELDRAIEKIADSHDSLEDYFWGDWEDAYDGENRKYPLLLANVSTPVEFAKITTIKLNLAAVAQVARDQSNLKEVESDTLQYLHDVYKVMKYSPWWNGFCAVSQASVGLKFKDDSADQVAGWQVTLTIKMIEGFGLCDIPLTGYDPSPIPQGNCLPATLLIQRSDQSLLEESTVPSGQTDTFVVPDSVITLQNTLPAVISVSSVLATDPLTLTAPDATISVENSDGTEVDNGVVVSGGSGVLTAPDAVEVISDTASNILYTDNIPSGTTNPRTILDGDIRINSVSTFSILAEGVQNINLVDPDGNTIEVDSVTGDNLNIFLYWFQIAVLLFRNQLITDSATFETPEDATNKIIEIGETDYGNALQVITPNGYKAGFIYPTKGSENTDVDRLSTTTRFNEDGVLETLGNDVPMITFVDGGWAIGGFEQRTNLVTYSDDFTQAAWVKSSSGTGSIPAVTANSAPSIISGQMADLVVFDRGAGNGSSDSSFLQISIPHITGNDYTGSMYIKAASAVDVGKEISMRPFGTSYSVFILTDKWQKVEGTLTATVNNNVMQISNRGGTTIENSVSLLLAGVQVTQSSSSGDYPLIPTTGAMATRIEDVNTVTVPAGTTQITEYFTDGIANVITTIPATHTYSKGLIRKIIFE